MSKSSGVQVRILPSLMELVYSTAALALDSRTLLPGDKKLSLFKDSPTKLWEELGDHVRALLCKPLLRVSSGTY